MTVWIVLMQVGQGRGCKPDSITECLCALASMDGGPQEDLQTRAG